MTVNSRSAYANRVAYIQELEHRYIIAYEITRWVVKHWEK